MLLLGHRGARRYAAENSCEAFDLALAHGCDGFEFDVRLTCDSRPIVCHDSTISEFRIETTSYSEIVENCFKSQGWLRRRRDHRAICCLDEVLAAFSSRAFLDIELKVPGLEDLVCALLSRVPLPHGFVVSSFLPEVLRELHARESALPLGYIADSRKRMELWRELPVSWVMPKASLVNKSAVDEFHGAGKEILVWTVNREAEMRRFAEYGVDGLISDDTRRLGRVFGRTE